MASVSGDSGAGVGGAARNSSTGDGGGASAIGGEAGAGAGAGANADGAAGATTGGEGRGCSSVGKPRGRVITRLRRTGVEKSPSLTAMGTRPMLPSLGGGSAPSVEISAVSP